MRCLSFVQFDPLTPGRALGESVIEFCSSIIRRSVIHWLVPFGTKSERTRAIIMSSYSGRRPYTVGRLMDSTSRSLIGRWRAVRWPYTVGRRWIRSVIDRYGGVLECVVYRSFSLTR